MGTMLRRMGPADLAAVVRIWQLARVQSMPELEARLAHTHEDDVRQFRDVVFKENEVWLACRQGTIAGLMAYSNGCVEQLYVAPKFQGLGVGSALLDKAKELSPGRLTLFTFQKNRRARAFYEKRDFTSVAFGISPAPESEPDVRYQWCADRG